MKPARRDRDTEVGLVAEDLPVQPSAELVRLRDSRAREDERSNALAHVKSGATSVDRDRGPMSELEQRMAELDEKNEEIAAKNEEIAERDRLLKAIFQSKSWRLTRPLRWFMGQLRPDSAEDPSFGGYATDLKYRVDAFRIVSRPFGARLLEISGWCFAPADQAPVRLKVRGDGQTLLELECNLERPDVVAGFAAMPQIASPLPFCGFAEVVDLADGPFSRFELTTARRHRTLAQGTMDELIVPPDSAELDKPVGFAEVARRVWERARAKVNYRTILSPTKWRLWLRQLAAEYKIFRADSRVPSSIAVGNVATADAQTHPCANNGRVLKVAFFSHNLNLEGATRVVLDVALGCSKSGRLAPTIVSPTDGKAREWMEGQGIPCVILPLQGTDNALAGWKNVGDYVQSVDGVCEFLARERPDIVLANVLNNFFVIEAASRLSIPSLWLIHESYDRQQFVNSVDRFAVRACERAFQLAQQVIFVSEGTRQLYERYNERKNFRVIHNALPPEKLATGARTGKSTARHVLGIPVDKKMILSVGTVCARKDQATLIKGLILLAQRRRDFVAYIVGARHGVPYTEAMARLIARSAVTDCVKIVEETASVDNYYRAADLFAFASLNESFPLVTLEAMAHGLPVVTTNCIGVSEQVRFGENALAFEFGDAAGLAQRLDELLSDHERMEKMAGNSRAISAGMQSYDGMIGQYEALLLSALRISPPGMETTL